MEYKRVQLRTKESKGSRSVARPTIYGNPFSVEKYGRETSIKYYETFLDDLVSCVPEFFDDLLCAEKIGCFCSLDKKCHADTIIAYLKKRRNKLRFIKDGLKKLECQA